MNRVAYMGEQGAYGDEAARAWAGAGAQPLPCPRFGDVFAAVRSGRAEAGVVPVENSQTGPIVEVLDLLLAEPLFITGEHELRVRHCLLAPPGLSLEEVRTVHSHPQALSQCREFLDQHGMKPMNEGDTAGSARLISAGKMPGAAAIASRSAAEIYGLKILAEGIETNPENVTRFVAIAVEGVARSARARTSLTLALEDRPGALMAALSAFAAEGLNLSHLCTRPRRRRTWETVFYLDLDGHLEDPPLARALAALEKCTEFVRVLGSYPKA